MSNNWQYSTYSDIDSQVKQNFPFKKPRIHQLETISEIKYAIDKGYKYIVLEAGTGTGKSVIAATLAEMYGSTYILTITKQLQDQYQRDFKDLGFKVVKGRGNFKCKKYAEENIKNRCDEGRCILEGYNCGYSIKRKSLDKINKSSSCEYEYQKWVAINSDVVISNYHYMFLELNYNQDFNKRKLLVCDEAHNLEDTIMQQLKLEFSRKELKEYGMNLSKDLVARLNDGNYINWIEFIKKIKERYSKEYEKIKELKKSNVGDKIAYLKRRIEDCSRFIKHIRHDPQKWIFDYDSYYGVCEFKPIQVDNYAEKNLFDYADTCLFMSATILDYKLFAKWLGINENEIYAIRRESPFEVDRNPIKTYSDFNMSYNKLSQSAQESIPAIKEILDLHKNDKGIIHTVSHQCKSFLMKNLDNDRLIDHKTYNRARQLKKFKKSKKPLVLISPSMNEGVDLPGSQCRFQIIYKIPYPSLADKQTKLRKNIDKQWYEYKTALALVQTYGRGMRYEKDYCKTYFIDSRLTSFVAMDEARNHFLPDSFKKAINITPAVIDETEDEDYVEEIEFVDDIIDEEVINDKNPVEAQSVSNIETNESCDDLSYTQKVDLKYKLTLKGQQLLDNKQYDEAIEFYKGLITHDLFVNDYHPYLKLSKAYSGAGQCNNEVETLVNFFSSGIYCRKSKLKWFKKRLKELSNLGYFDYSSINQLEDKFSSNGAKNRSNAAKPVPTALKIKNAKKKNKSEIFIYEPEFFDSIVKIDENKSYGEKIDFKYELYNMGRLFLDNKEYGKAIGFYQRLLTHELFINDYHPYLKLSQAYRKSKQYDDERDLIVNFFKSGIYCSQKQLNWFKRKLKQLQGYGFFDYSTIDDLEYEFKINGAKNKELSDIPVPTVFKIKKAKIEELNNINIDEFYDSIAYTNETMSYDEKVEIKSKLIDLGNEYIDNKQYGLAIVFYNKLLSHDLFVNDYHPYRKLSRVFRKDKQYEKEVEILVKFFKSGIYCDDKQLNWFKKRLKQLSKYDNFDYSTIGELEDEFYRNGANNKNLADTPVPIAAKIKKSKKSKTNATKYSEKYFRKLAKEISEEPGFISDREFSKLTQNDFISFDDYNDVNEKADLINEGKEIEKEDAEEAIKFYEKLKYNRLFVNDYYPYRRQCILFKNKIKNDRKDWNTIVDFFSKGIYCNDHQYIWFKNKIAELTLKLDLNGSEISKIESLVKAFDKNRDLYEKMQDIPVPIAERIKKDEDGLRVISVEKYNNVQNIYYIKELGVGYIRRGEYENAIKYYADLLNDDLLYFRYHAYKQFARIFKEMKNPDKFKKLYEGHVS